MWQSTVDRVLGAPAFMPAMIRDGKLTSDNDLKQMCTDPSGHMSTQFFAVLDYRIQQMLTAGFVTKTELKYTVTEIVNKLRFPAL